VVFMEYIMSANRLMSSLPQIGIGVGARTVHWWMHEC
jgi:hypothetical protein